MSSSPVIVSKTTESYNLQSVQKWPEGFPTNFYAPFTHEGETDMSDEQREWRQLYVEALLETNPLNLAGRVATAEKAIFLRTKELRTGLVEQVERNAMADAMSSLSVLRRECKRPTGTKAETRPALGQVTARSPLSFSAR
jgi:hypothetical protein